MIENIHHTVHKRGTLPSKRVVLTCDTELHRKGDSGILLSNVGRGVLSAYEILFYDGNTEYVMAHQFDFGDKVNETKKYQCNNCGAGHTLYWKRDSIDTIEFMACDWIKTAMHSKDETCPKCGSDMELILK